MRSPKIEEQNKGSSYDLSISDLMAALCCIFILFFVFGINKLNTERKRYEEEVKELKRQTGVASEYRQFQSNIFNALKDEFEDDLIKWNAEIIEENGIILFRFKDDRMMFNPFSSEPKENFKVVLNDFFPRFISVLWNQDFSDQIEEIRIEGHTGREEKKSYNDDYEDGVILSQQRTRSVMKHCFDLLQGEEKKWVQDKTAAIGYSLSRPIEIEGEINWKMSRRVEFSIRTSAESVIQSLEKKTGVRE